MNVLSVFWNFISSVIYVFVDRWPMIILLRYILTRQDGKYCGHVVLLVHLTVFRMTENCTQNWGNLYRHDIHTCQAINETLAVVWSLNAKVIFIQGEFVLVSMEGYISICCLIILHLYWWESCLFLGAAEVEMLVNFTIDRIEAQVSDIHQNELENSCNNIRG